ncbi:MAG: hypothetical protein A2Z99_05310 [Treponema sp. GWB1_62_6]|nr:MAG: hypothetical protein A2413_09650 [Treponema sp. RIFOXYC1_FULL_61_9]OHE69333.1 MAG: hypothetical protein A2001_12690 [Treponema sp. GWC1_61_84]OHE70732.1 MAG: hypothetical protein A2Z99_05310 [Treponema sp. GWB1_62_6]HCM26253.1 ribosomal-processing cysteine protease Prp [Treponema sp.]
MIVVDVVLDDAGLLRSCVVQGHAGAGPRGSDVVCAAVSILARTALRTLSVTEGVTVRGGAPERGAFGMEVDCDRSAAVRLSATTDFLMEGFRSVAEDHPDHCTIRIRKERRQDNGS